VHRSYHTPDSLKAMTLVSKGGPDLPAGAPAWTSADDASTAKTTAVTKPENNLAT